LPKNLAAEDPFRDRHDLHCTGRSFPPTLWRMGDKSDDTQGHRGRLRERLLQGDGNTLVDHELVEYLLTAGLPRVDTKARGKQVSCLEPSA